MVSNYTLRKSIIVYPSWDGQYIFELLYNQGMIYKIYMKRFDIGSPNLREKSIDDIEKLMERVKYMDQLYVFELLNGELYNFYTIRDFGNGIYYPIVKFINGDYALKMEMYNRSNIRIIEILYKDKFLFNMFCDESGETIKQYLAIKKFAYETVFNNVEELVENGNIDEHKLSKTRIQHDNYDVDVINYKDQLDQLDYSLHIYTNTNRPWYEAYYVKFYVGYDKIFDIELGSFKNGNIIRHD